MTALAYDILEVSPGPSRSTERPAATPKGYRTEPELKPPSAAPEVGLVLNLDMLASRFGLEIHLSIRESVGTPATTGSELESKAPVKKGSSNHNGNWAEIGDDIDD